MRRLITKGELPFNLKRHNALILLIYFARSRESMSITYPKLLLSRSKNTMCVKDVKSQ